MMNIWQCEKQFFLMKLCFQNLQCSLSYGKLFCTTLSIIKKTLRQAHFVFVPQFLNHVLVTCSLLHFYNQMFLICNCILCYECLACVFVFVSYEMFSHLNSVPPCFENWFTQHQDVEWFSINQVLSSHWRAADIESPAPSVLHHYGAHTTALYYFIYITTI